MQATRYLVSIRNSTTGQWRTTIEPSLRKAIALTWGLTTAYYVTEEKGELLTVGGEYRSHKWSHNWRAFKQTLKPLAFRQFHQLLVNQDGKRMIDKIVEAFA